VYAVDIGSPHRAIEMYEEILAIDEQQQEALTELARLKTSAGDVTAAVSAVERLAEQEQDPIARSQLYVRVGKLLNEGGDRDRAIVAYKRALDLDKYASSAAEGLREIYGQRGDARGAVEMLMHAIGIADGDLKRASLLAELGTLYKHQLDDVAQASVAFEQALELDPTSTGASAGLAGIAFAEERFGDTVDHFERIEGRLDELPRDHAAELCAEAAQAYKALGDNDKSVAARKRARELLPSDLKTAERYAEALAENGDPSGAERLYEKLLEQFESELDASDRIRLMLAGGEAQLLAGTRSKRAIETFGRVLEMKPDDPTALDALTRAQEQAGNWNEVINLLQLRSRRAADSEQVFDLMVKTGDVFLEKIRDREAACRTYVMALDVRPDSRNLLTKLMGVYSDAKDWPRLIEIILRIAEMVKEPAALAKYYNTAATIAHQELSRFDEAANYYEEALSHLGPEEGDAQFMGLTQCLTENQDWERLERAYERRIARMRQAGLEGEGNARIAAMLDACGDIVQSRLGRLADALRMYEEAMELEPENENRRAMLASIYSKEPKRFFQRAVAAHRVYLDRDPYRVDSLQALRKIYTSGKRPDESWCVCQALRCLKMADVDEEKFFKKYRLTRLPKVKQPVTDDVFRELVVHPAQDATLTAIFAILQPAVVAVQSQQLAAFGVHESYRADPNNDQAAMARMIGHVGETLSVHLPPTYHCPQDPGGLSFLFTAPPSIGIGEGAKAGGPQQALAFVAGRHLSYYRQGHFLRQLVPTGTGLRGWLIGAIRTVVPRFPAPATMEAHVNECVQAIQRQLPGPQRDALRSLTQKLLEAAPELDMKAWMAGVDLTADRIGFVLSNDLKIANAVIEASPEDAASIGRKDRLRELLAYSISEPYFELRKRIGIALGG
jgi:tetratricopeptide (TPR) repeat protein